MPPQKKRTKPVRAAKAKKPASKRAVIGKGSAKKTAVRKSTPKNKTTQKGSAKKTAVSKGSAKKPKTAPQRTRAKSPKKIAKKAPKSVAKKVAKKKSEISSIATNAKALAKGPPMTKKYMSAQQQKWFRAKLEDMLRNIEAEAKKTAKDLLAQERGLADEFDRAHNEFAFVVDLRENERISNLQVKINHALRLLETSAYGYCDDCGEPIGISRMAARPVATKCIDCKQFQEDLEHHGI